MADRKGFSVFREGYPSMNKAKLAQEIDHTLKAAKFNKSVIKGIGWKGRGTRHLTNGFVIDTKSNGVVIVRYHDWDNTSFMTRHKEELNSAGWMALNKSLGRVRASLANYKAALAGFVVEDKENEYGLPYLEISARAAAPAP
jgi:hypothetical protein